MADLIVNSWWSFVGSGVNLFDDCWWSLDIISITISEIKSHCAFWYNFFVDFVLGRLWRSVFVSTSFSFELLVFSGWWSLCGFWCGLPAKASVRISVVFVSKVFCICGWWSLCGFWKFGVGSLRRHPSGYRELYLCQKYFVFVSKVFCICGWWSLVVGDLCVGFGVGSLRRHQSGYREAAGEGGTGTGEPPPDACCCASPLTYLTSLASPLTYLTGPNTDFCCWPILPWPTFLKCSPVFGFSPAMQKKNCAGCTFKLF